MTRPEPAFDGVQSDILQEIYEWPDVTFSSHTLTQRLHPAVQVTAREYRSAFVQVCIAIEKHIVSGFIRGKRTRDDHGVFFNNLKLTSKGEQAAIQERDRRALPEKVAQIMDIVELVRNDRAKDGAPGGVGRP